MRLFSRTPFVAAALSLVASMSLSNRAHAEQTRDFMIAAPSNGTDVLVDAILPGAQLAVEHKVPIYGMGNQLTMRANALYTLPFYESQADVDLRILALTLGGSGGFRTDFGHMGFAPGESIERPHRRLRFVNGEVDTKTWGFGEGRATLSLPFNDYLVFNAVNTLRFEDSPDRSYDQRLGIVHDGGMLFKSDIQLFFKHRDIGGLAPMMQVVNFKLGSNRFTEINYGFAFVTRPGFRRGYDMLFLQVLFHPGSTFGTYDNSNGYGLHLLFSPVTFLLAYRMVIPVWRPE